MKGTASYLNSRQWDEPHNGTQVLGMQTKDTATSSSKTRQDLLTCIRRCRVFLPSSFHICRIDWSIWFCPREAQSTYVYLKSTTVYVPSSELGPLSRQRVCPPPGSGGRAHSPAVEGLGESQFWRLKIKLSTLPTLCLEALQSVQSYINIFLTFFIHSSKYNF